MNNVSGGAVLEPPLPGHHVPALVLGTLLILLIIAGNLLVCLSVCTERPLRTATNVFIASLAVSDLLLALLVLPLYVFQEFQGGVWTLGPGLCDYLMTMDVMLCTASIFNLCAISVDRFIAVSVPLNYSRKHIDTRQVALISMTWILAFAVASPIAFGLNHVPDRDASVCRLEGSRYIIWSSVCSFVLPCPVMLLLYCGMLRGLKRWEQARSHRLRRNMHGFRKINGSPSEPQSPREELQPFPDPACDLSEHPERSLHTLSSAQLKYVQTRPGGRKQAKINGREHKAMKVLPIVVGAFLFCWTPFFVVHITRASCETCNIPPQLISTVTWLGYVNSALNPIIYTIFNEEFRNFFRKILYPCC
ncbi:D(4) dopamine receptor-like [Pristis pectinata]|uniref:D(4) dopamine receptor-like n=1 Tax=Pristis pectinata TaxID=685728 RepID=UPI00223CF687|nr:D(4) dopamine receptor-like [Pristis pectinata]